MTCRKIKKTSDSLETRYYDLSMKNFNLEKLLLFVITTLSLNLFAAVLSPAYMESQNVDEAKLYNLQDNQVDQLPEEFTFPGQPKKVALFYGKGTWFFGKRHLKNFLYSHGRSYKVIYERDILNGSLNKGAFHTLVMPGGKSWIYIENLGDKGAQEILKFVNAGGNYLGICAGAFYATSHRQGPNPTPVPYGIGLLTGIAFDGTALKTPPFKGGMLDFQFFLTGFNKSYRILLLGGSSFQITPEEMKIKKIQIYSQFAPNFPAMVAFDFGKGKVFLSGPHLEVEESQSILGLWYRDPDSEWPILEAMFANHFKNNK